MNCKPEIKKVLDGMYAIKHYISFSREAEENNTYKNISKTADVAILSFIKLLASAAEKEYVDICKQEFNNMLWNLGENVMLSKNQELAAYVAQVYHNKDVVMDHLLDE